MSTRVAVVVLGLVASGTAAQAGGIVAPPASYRPPGRVAVGATASAHVLGAVTFAQPDRGELADGATAFTGSGAIYAGVFVLPNIEVGAALRYAPSIRLRGEDAAKREFDVFGRFGAHLWPWRQLDIGFAAHLGYGHITLAKGEGIPDPTGLVVDVVATGGYPVGGGLWVTAGLGVQHGFEHTTVEPIPGKPADASYTTTFLHVDVGVAYRF